MLSLSLSLMRKPILNVHFAKKKKIFLWKRNENSVWFEFFTNQGVFVLIYLFNFRKIKIVGTIFFFIISFFSIEITTLIIYSNNKEKLFNNYFLIKFSLLLWLWEMCSCCLETVKSWVEVSCDWCSVWCSVWEFTATFIVWL